MVPLDHEGERLWMLERLHRLRAKRTEQGSRTDAFQILTLLVQRIAGSADRDDSSARRIAATVGSGKFRLTITIESNVPFQRGSGIVLDGSDITDVRESSRLTLQMHKIEAHRLSRSHCIRVYNQRPQQCENQFEIIP